MNVQDSVKVRLGQHRVAFSEILWVSVVKQVQEATGQVGFTTVHIEVVIEVRELNAPSIKQLLGPIHP